MSVSVRRGIAKDINDLVRQRQITEDQLLHLMWIFSQEENVKITRNMTRRLLRLEKYSEATIQKVTAFLQQVKECQLEPLGASDSEGAAQSQPQPSGEASTSIVSIEYDAAAENQLEQLREQEMKRRKVRSLENREARAPKQSGLPEVHPEGGGGDRRGGLLAEPATGRYLTDVSVLNGWLALQTKHCKSSKKGGQSLAAPYGQATALPVNARVLVKKKKKRTRAAVGTTTRRATTAARPKGTRKKRPVVVVVEEDEEEEQSSASDASIEVVPLQLDEEEGIQRSRSNEGEVVAYNSEGGYGEEEDEDEDDEMLDLGVDEEAEEDEEDELEEDSVISGQELSDDLGIEGSIQFGSESDD